MTTEQLDRALEFARERGMDAYLDGDSVVIVIPFIYAGQTLGADTFRAYNLAELRHILGY